MIGKVNPQAKSMEMTAMMTEQLKNTLTQEQDMTNKLTKLSTLEKLSAQENTIKQDALDLYA